MEHTSISTVHPLTRGLDWWYVGQAQISNRWISLSPKKQAATMTVPADFAPSTTAGWGPSKRFGRSVQVLKFPNSGASTLDLPTGDILSTTTPFTIAWWENTHSDTVFQARFFLDYGAASWQVLRSNSASYGPLNWGIQSSGALVRGGVATLANSVGIWKHFTLVGRAGPVSETGSNWDCYENGRSVTITGGGAGSSFKTNRIGTWSTNYANAALDDIAIWPARAFNQAEVLAWYRSSLAGHPAIFQHKKPPLFVAPAVEGPSGLVRQRTVRGVGL